MPPYLPLLLTVTDTITSFGTYALFSNIYVNSAATTECLSVLWTEKVSEYENA